jgi:hypothetical protein
MVNGVYSQVIGLVIRSSTQMGGNTQVVLGFSDPTAVLGARRPAFSCTQADAVFTPHLNCEKLRKFR